MAVIAPGNWIYPFLPGIKVEVFHGYPINKRAEKKDDHFTLRGWFDIYCTQGPSSTIPFLKLEQQKGYFKVYETGWPKADDTFNPNLPPEPKRQRPCILYGTTFSKGISSVWEMAPVIDRLASEKGWDWIITFHPKLMNDSELLKSASCEEVEHSHEAAGRAGLAAHHVRHGLGVDARRGNDRDEAAKRDKGEREYDAGAQLLDFPNIAESGHGVSIKSCAN